MFLTRFLSTLFSYIFIKACVYVCVSIFIMLIRNNL